MTSQVSNAKAQLDFIRISIDTIDSELLELINKRMELSYQIGQIKASSQNETEDCKMPIYDGKRECDILDRLANINTGRLSSEQITSIWAEIFTASREIQKNIVNGVQK